MYKRVSAFCWRASASVIPLLARDTRACPDRVWLPFASPPELRCRGPNSSGTLPVHNGALPKDRAVPPLETHSTPHSAAPSRAKLFPGNNEKRLNPAPAQSRFAALEPLPVFHLQPEEVAPASGVALDYLGSVVPRASTPLVQLCTHSLPYMPGQENHDRVA